MPELSSYPRKTSLDGPERIPIVTNPGVAGGNGYITADDLTTDILANINKATLAADPAFSSRFVSVTNTPAPIRPAPPAAIAYVGEEFRLPRSRAITGTNNAGNVVHLLSSGDAPISPNPYVLGQMFVGDPGLDYVSFLSTIDAGSGDIIDFHYAGNRDALLDSYLIQGLDSTISGYDTRLVGIATRAPGTTGTALGVGLLSRLEVNSGQAIDASYVRTQSARLQLVATTGLTKVLQVLANNKTTELVAIDAAGHLRLTPSGAAVNQIESYYGGVLQFMVAPDGTYGGFGVGAPSTAAHVGAVGPASQPALMLGLDTTLYREGALRLATPVTHTFKVGRNVTGSRPNAVTVGAAAMFYDTTLSKPIWSDGAVWRDAAGTAV